MLLSLNDAWIDGGTPFQAFQEAGAFLVHNPHGSTFAYANSGARRFPAT
jgi:hypothetical protein